MKKSKNASCDPTEERTTTDAADPAAGDAEPPARAPKTIITPVSKRIGEGSGNLQKRGDWYQRRTGGGS